MANLRLPLGLSIVALVIAVAALVLAVVLPGPEGPQGLPGEEGPQGPEAAPPEPAATPLPTWSVESQWVYELFDSASGYTGNVTMNVTGQEAVDAVGCYTLDFTLDPAMMGVISSGDAWMEKDTLLVKKREMSWIDGIYTYTIVHEFSYEFDTALWPLEVGEEVGMTQTYNWTMTMDTLVISAYSETINGMMKVEGKENKTVIAGEFDCFEVVFRDVNELVRTRMWYSDQVKSWVKTVNYDENGDPFERLELKSYSM